jgi:S1-C subfamily serine protease
MTEPGTSESGISDVSPAPIAPRRGGIASTALLVLCTALLSASLTAGFTYFAVTNRSNAAATPTAQAASPAADAQTVSLTQTEATIRVANMAKPAVVTITTTGLTGYGPFSMPTTGAGSGFIVSSDGLILTNYHVVMDSRSLTVDLQDGRQLEAQVVSTDQTNDLALIKIAATGLSTLELGDSDAVQVGQLAIAIGSPLGTFTDSVTQGIVSGLDRDITVGERGSNFTEDLTGLIQTDAAINAGNSGGPLLDASGRVVGVITASTNSAQEIGFAVPINRARALVEAATGSQE